QQGKVPLLSLEDYSPLVVDCLEVLPPEMIIMRLMGDAPRTMLVAPTWSLDKRAALQRIEQELERRDPWRGGRNSSPSFNAWGCRSPRSGSTPTICQSPASRCSRKRKPCF